MGLRRTLTLRVRGRRQPVPHGVVGAVQLDTTAPLTVVEGNYLEFQITASELASPSNGSSAEVIQDLSTRQVDLRCSDPAVFAVSRPAPAVLRVTALAGGAASATVFVRVDGVASNHLTVSRIPAVSPPVTVTQLTIVPSAVTMVVSTTRAFTCTALYSDGSSGPFVPTWQTSAGSIDSGGVLTAPGSPTSLTVTALDPNGSASETADVTVQAAGSFTALMSEDFSNYLDDLALRAAYSGGASSRYVWNGGGKTDGLTRIRLVTDPTFGKVCRVTNPAQSPFYDLANAPAGLPGAMYRLRANWGGLRRDFWLRFRFRFWTKFRTKGARYLDPTLFNDPSINGGSYKLIFANPSQGGGRITYTWQNGSQADPGSAQIAEEFYSQQQGVGRHATILVQQAGSAFNQDGAEFNDRNWYEGIFGLRTVYHGPSASLTRLGMWGRRLTTNDGTTWTWAPGAWRRFVREVLFDYEVYFAGSHDLGENKNHGNPIDFEVDWGPWDLVDPAVYANPFDVPTSDRDLVFA